MHQVSPRAAHRLASSAALVVLAALSAACSADSPVHPAAPDAGERPGSIGREALRIARWSDPASWPSGEVPAEGADVVVPQGATIVLDVSTPPLGTVKVEGELAFDDREVELTARAVQVRGVLRIGSEARPHLHKATITLTGEDPGNSTLASKAIAVFNGGKVEMHGPRRSEWTRLAAHAPAGSTTLTLEEAVDWRVGDRIAISSTSFDPREAEDVVVADVRGATVTLAAPLRHSHWGTLQTVAGQTLDQRAEVGLLTRNIVVRGDEASNRTGYGAHVIVFVGGSARVEGIELTRVGQTGHLARYPIHWHMNGSTSGQYARGNSIWKTYSRCVTVHGTHDVMVSRNVCYDHLGHGYFVEDGNETRNTFEGNLGMLTRTPPAGRRLLPSDASPATFWITNPDNSWRGNVAAGSEGFGYWFGLPEHPTGPSATNTVWPTQTPLREFRGNVAHSNSFSGLHVDDGPTADAASLRTMWYRPRLVPGDESSPPVPADFRDFVAWKNSVRGAWIRGDQMAMTGAVLADNRTGVIFASPSASFQRSLVVGESENRTPTRFPTLPIHGFEFYDGVVYAKDVTFANFASNGARDAGALGLEMDNAAIVNAGNWAEGLTFVNANRVAFPRAPQHDGDKGSVFRDVDGSVSGIAGATVVARNPLLIDDSCTLRAEWNAAACRGRYVGLSITAFAGWEPPVAPMTIRRQDGASVTMKGYTEKWVATPVPANRRFTLAFPGAAPSRPHIAYEHIAEGDWVVLSFPYTYPHFDVRLGSGYERAPAAASYGALEDSRATTWYLDRSAGVMHVKIVGRGGGERAGAVFVQPTR